MKKLILLLMGDICDNTSNKNTIRDIFLYIKSICKEKMNIKSMNSVFLKMKWAILLKQPTSWWLTKTRTLIYISQIYYLVSGVTVYYLMQFSILIILTNNISLNQLWYIPNLRYITFFFLFQLITFKHYLISSHIIFLVSIIAHII